MNWPRGQVLLLACFGAAYFGFIAWYHSPYAGGADSSGYMNSARLMLEGRLFIPLTAPPGLPTGVFPPHVFAPIGFQPSPDGLNLLPNYPPGLPLHFAILGHFIGIGPATLLVSLAAALGFALLLNLTAREFGVRPGWALLLMIEGALSPLVLQYAMEPMSDLVAAVWALLVMLCALRSARHAGWAAGAGAALGMAVLVRPTNLLLALPAVLALRFDWKSWTAFILAGLPAAFLQAYYNHTVFGSVLMTGYGEVKNLFSWRYVLPTLWHYLVWMPVVATPLVFAALALPRLRLAPRLKAALLLWGGSFLLFYAAYDFSRQAWWYLRFLLPALPAAGIAAALVLQDLRFSSWLLESKLVTDRTTPVPGPIGRLFYVPVALLAGLICAGWLCLWSPRLFIGRAELDARPYFLAGRWVTEQMPPGAVVVACQVSGSLLYYANQRCIDFNHLTPESSSLLVDWAGREHRAIYALLFPFEESVAWTRLPGHWERVRQLREVTVWRRTGPAEAPDPAPR